MPVDQKMENNASMRSAKGNNNNEEEGGKMDGHSRADESTKTTVK